MSELRSHGTIVPLYLNIGLWMVCRLEASWIPTAENVWADNLSRDRDSTDWRLNRSVFQSLNAAWGPCGVDRFATASTSMLPTFNSLVPCPRPAAVDGWAQDWGGGIINYVSHPFSQAALVTRKIFRDRASAVVVLPAWPAQVWWAETLHRANAAFFLPASAALYSRGGSNLPAHPPLWLTVALFYRAGGRPCPRWSGAPTPTPRPWTDFPGWTAPTRRP